MPRVRCSRPRMPDRSAASLRVMPTRWCNRSRCPAGGCWPGRARKICRGSPAWMVFSMRCWKNIVSAGAFAALAACAAGGDAAQLRVRSASVDQGVLTAHLLWQPSDAVLDALDHGIVLDFVVDLRAY